MRNNSAGDVKFTPSQQNRPIQRYYNNNSPNISTLSSPFCPLFLPFLLTLPPLLYDALLSDDKSNSYQQPEPMGSCSTCSIFIALVMGIVFLTAFGGQPATVVVGVFFLSYAAIGMCYHCCRACFAPNRPPPAPNNQPLLWDRLPYYQDNQRQQFREPSVHPARNVNRVDDIPEIPEENDEPIRQTFHQEQCTVCFDAFGPTDVIARLNCGHKFHQNCIVDWLERQLNCPNCRKPLE